MSEPAEHATLTSVATALIPAGIPAENTPDAWKALHADMLVDDKIKALAEHFGCSTHFRRMLKSESAALEVGTAVMVWWAVDGLQSGKIGAVNTDGTFVIHYDDDGQSQATVGLAVRLCALLCWAGNTHSRCRWRSVAGSRRKQNHHRIPRPSG